MTVPDTEGFPPWISVASGITFVLAVIGQVWKYFAGLKEDVPSRNEPKFSTIDQASMEESRLARIIATAVSPQVAAVAQQLSHVTELVAANNQILVQTKEMLAILNKLDRALDVEEEVKLALRQSQVEAILAATKRANER